jgi:hypothetical protein
VQACLGVRIAGLLVRPRAGQDIPALLALIHHGQEHASRLASLSDDYGRNAHLTCDESAAEFGQMTTKRRSD